MYSCRSFYSFIIKIMTLTGFHCLFRCRVPIPILDYEFRSIIYRILPMRIRIKAGRIHIVINRLLTRLAVATVSKLCDSWHILHPGFHFLCGTDFSRSYPRRSSFKTTEWIMHWWFLRVDSIMINRFVFCIFQFVIRLWIFIFLIGSVCLWLMISSLARVSIWIIVQLRSGSISWHKVGLTISHDLLLIRYWPAIWGPLWEIIHNFLSFRALAALTAIHDDCLFRNSWSGLRPFFGCLSFVCAS